MSFRCLLALGLLVSLQGCSRSEPGCDLFVRTVADVQLPDGSFHFEDVTFIGDICLVEYRQLLSDLTPRLKAQEIVQVVLMRDELHVTVHTCLKGCTPPGTIQGGSGRTFNLEKRAAAWVVVEEFLWMS